jgi:hypothetical protein
MDHMAKNSGGIGLALLCGVPYLLIMVGCGLLFATGNFGNSGPTLNIEQPKAPRENNLFGKTIVLLDQVNAQQ